MGDFRVTLIHDIYPPRCIEAVTKEYRSSVLASVIQKDEHETILAISGKSGRAAEERAVHEFLNRLLDLSIRAAFEGS